jgi:hypothetical protein
MRWMFVAIVIGWTCLAGADIATAEKHTSQVVAQVMRPQVSCRHHPALLLVFWRAPSCI